MNKQDLISKIKQLDGISQNERAYLINLVRNSKRHLDQLIVNTGFSKHSPDYSA